MSTTEQAAPAHEHQFHDDVQEVRTLADAHDLEQATLVFRAAMVGVPFPAGGDVAVLLEPGRTLAVGDGDVIVGTTTSFACRLTVPGGARVPHAAVTHVGVLPSHTRRGIVTRLLGRQLRDLANRGEVLASLRASEAVIYERFGFGIASQTAGYEISRRRARLRPGVAPGSPVRLVDRDAGSWQVRDIYKRATWVGAIERYPQWWSGRELWAAAASGPAYLAVSGPPGRENGYAIYHPTGTADWWSSRDRTVVVDDLVALDDDAYLGLVRHFATLDPVDTVQLPGRPVDDPLPWLFDDPRAVPQLSVRDETWLRLVDVDAALQARSYESGPEVVLAVEDELLPDNSGRYRVSAGHVTRVDQPPDLSMDVAALASAYLGGARFATLALAGRVVEHREGALADADRLFRTAAAPFSGTGF